jgi:hypothetical protein
VDPQVDQPEPGDVVADVGCLSEAFASMGQEGLDLDAKGPPSCIVVVIKYPDGTVYDLATGPDATPEMKRELLGVAGLKALRDAGVVEDKPKLLVPHKDFQIGMRGPH